MDHKRTQLFPKRTGNKPETFAITVKGYNTTAPQPYVTGVRIDNGEEVNVYLRQDVDYTRSSYPRSEIKDFAADRKDRQHPGTVAGGVLLIQEGFKQADGSFGARWIQSLSHAPGEAQVFIATAHVSHVKNSDTKTKEFPNGRPYALMTILHDGDFSHLDAAMADKLKLCTPFPVANTEELQSAVTELLTAEIGVGVRVSNEDGFDARYVRHRRGEDCAASVDAFMKDVLVLKDQIDSGAVRVEVIPYTNIWAGPKTVEAMVKHKVMAKRVERYNVLDADEYNVPQYRPTIVAVRFTKEGEAAFFSHFEPLVTREPSPGLVNAIAYAQTELLSLEVPRANAPANASTEPEAGEEYRGFSADTQDDIVGAVGGAIPGGEDFDDDIPAAAAATPAANDAAAAPANKRRWTGNRR